MERLWFEKKLDCEILNKEKGSIMNETMGEKGSYQKKRNE